MATQTYVTPGVYVEIEDRGPKPITAVGMSVPAFVGITRTCSEGESGRAIPISNWTQFVEKFGTEDDGPFISEAYLPDAVYGHFNNGGGRCYVVSLQQVEGTTEELPEVVIEKNEKECFRVRARSAGELRVKIEEDDGGKTFTLHIHTSLGEEDLPGRSMAKKDGDAYIGNTKPQFADIVMPKTTTTAMPEPGVYRQERETLSPSAFVGNLGRRTGLAGLEAHEDVRLLLCPDIMGLYEQGLFTEEDVIGVQKAMIDQCEGLRDRFAILDTPPNLDIVGVLKWREAIGSSSYAGLYYPWIKVTDLGSAKGGTKFVPPSGYVAGIYNRSDGDRGVHKAPANEVIRGALGLEINVNKEENGQLNEAGVNCIRTFTGGRGVRVWGARTLAPASEGQWRYVNVRRLFIMIATSLEQGLQWVTFEPNNHELWSKVTRDITFFLDLVWRSGALFGQTPDEAFYVKCDEDLNPVQVRDQGQLIIEVGIAPTKPAEFVIIRLSQWAGQSVESEE